MGNSSARTAREMASAEGRDAALRLRLRGLSYQAIGAELGISRQAAHVRVTEALAEIPREAAEQVRAQEVERLDGILVRLVPLIDREVPDLAAVDRVLRVMDRRAALLGLDAPTKSELSGRDGGPIDVRAEHDALLGGLARIAARLAAGKRDPEPDGSGGGGT